MYVCVVHELGIKATVCVGQLLGRVNSTFFNTAVSITQVTVSQLFERQFIL